MDMLQVIIENNVIPHFTGFHTSVFKPGQLAPLHSHKDMHEVFHVASGVGTFKVDGVVHTIRAGGTVYLALGESHEVSNQGSEDLILLYFGVLE